MTYKGQCRLINYPASATTRWLSPAIECCPACILGRVLQRQTACPKVHSRSIFSLPLWFSMATDENQPVCAAVVRLIATRKSFPVRHFAKLLTVRASSRKGEVRAAKALLTGRESVPGLGRRKEYAFSQGSPNHRIHTQPLRGRNTKRFESAPRWDKPTGLHSHTRQRGNL
jgi:hypothetical protein